MSSKRANSTKANGSGTDGGRRRRSALLPGFLALAMIAAAFLAAMSGAQAVDDDNIFELGPGALTDEGGKTNILGDGNAGNGPDWADLFDANGDQLDPSLVAAFIKDDLSTAGATDKTTFSGAGGSNKNNDAITDWHWDTGNVPAKDDFANGYAYATFLDGHLIIYAGFERLAPEGDSHVDMEFFHDHVSLDEAVPCNDPGADPTPCNWLGTRTVGDIIASMDFTVGGGFGSLSIREWDGTGYVEIGSLGAQGCNAADTICGFNNGGTINGGPWPNFDRHGKVITNLPQNSFTEFGIDVTALEGGTPCITTVLGKTRSSQSFTAELKDFAGPSSFPLCEASIQINPDDVNEVGEEHTFTVWVNQTVAGVGTPAPDGTIVTVTLTASGGAAVNLIDDNCATGTVGGTCSVTFTSDTAGVVTGHASATVHLLDEEFFVETDGTGDNSGDATKRFVDAKIAIGPDDVNRIGETHTFTVTVMEDDGSGAGFVAAVGEHVDFTLTDSFGAGSVVDALASTCDNGGPNTDGAGQCTIVFTSNSPGLVTAHAQSSVQVGGISVFRETDGTGDNSGDATKRFVDARISIAPDDVNEVGQTHTFDVTVEKDEGDGAGFVGASGEHVSFTLNDANGAIDVIDADASTCDDAGPNTDLAGQCSIVFTSAIAGTVTGHASADVHVGGIVISVETDGAGQNSGDALKRFVDAFILIGPPLDTNSIEEDHTFTVTVMVDDGSPAGILAAPEGTIVSVSLTDTNGAISAISADTCAAGTVAGICTLTFTSASAGTVTAHASVDVLVMGVLLHRETDGQGQNSGDAIKVFVAGSIAWTKVDNVGRLQGGATFEVCRTADWNSDTSTYDPIDPICVDVLDDAAPDVDLDDGEFLLVDLVLGRYTVHETTAPPGYVPDPRTETVELNLTHPDATIELPFVNQRPILKLTGLGYTNEPTDAPGDGVVSGRTVYSFSIENFGGADALLDLTFVVSVPGGAGSGTVVYDGSTGPAPTSEPALGDDCIAAGCTITWDDVPVAAGASVSFTVAIVYDDAADGTEIRADLDATYTVDPSDGFERTASGAPATIIFTIQED